MYLSLSFLKKKDYVRNNGKFEKEKKKKTHTQNKKIFVGSKSIMQPLKCMTLLLSTYIRK
jgi:hypothetical protein